MFWIYASWARRTLIGMAFGVFLYALSPIFRPTPSSIGRRSSCQSNLKQIGLALAQYTQDYDEQYPSIITGGSAYGWADALQPYAKSTQIYQCPSELREGVTQTDKANPKEVGYTDYPFNARLNKKSTNSIQNFARQIVMLDGNDGREATNARYCLTEISPLWFSDEKSPSYRHRDTANYLFADGHVKAITPAQLGSTNGVF